MFKDIGGKIKNYAKAICWVGIILSIVSGVATIISGAKLQEYNATAEQGGSLIINGIITMITGSLASWVGSFLLYGFGELIERVVSIDTKLSANSPEGIRSPFRNESRPDAASNKQGNPQVNTQVKAVEENTSKEKAEIDSSWLIEGSKWVQCPGCGEKRPADFIRAIKKCPACGLNAMKDSQSSSSV